MRANYDEALRLFFSPRRVLNICSDLVAHTQLFGE